MECVPGEPNDGPCIGPAKNSVKARLISDALDRTFLSLADFICAHLRVNLPETSRSGYAQRSHKILRGIYRDDFFGIHSSVIQVDMRVLILKPLLLWRRH